MSSSKLWLLSWFYPESPSALLCCRLARHASVFLPGLQAVLESQLHVQPLLKPSMTSLRSVLCLSLLPARRTALGLSPVRISQSKRLKEMDRRDLQATEKCGMRRKRLVETEDVPFITHLNASLSWKSSVCHNPPPSSPSSLSQGSSDHGLSGVHS